MAQARAERGAALTLLSSLDEGGTTPERALAAVRRYDAVSEGQQALIASGRLAEAAAWDQAHLKPSHGAVLGSLADGHAGYEAAKQRSNETADVGGAVAMMFAGLVMGLLFWRLEQQRHSTDVLATEQDALRQSEQRFSALIRNATDVILIVEPDGRIRYQSSPATNLWGYAPDTLLGTSVFDLVHPNDVDGERQLVAQAATQPGMILTSEFRVRLADGAWHDNELVVNGLLDDPDVAGIVITCHDITERKSFEKELSRQAFHDPLTGLPNRALFLDRLSGAIGRSSRFGSAVTVLYLDLDNFKIVNDSLGHQAGDQLLIAFGERLARSVRQEDTVARLGGDEFAVLIEGASATEQALFAADRIAEALHAPFEIEGSAVFTTSSIGIARSDTSQDFTAAGLLRDADLAMYRAKGAGKAGYAVFDRSMASDADERLTLETDLRVALDRGEMRVHYQPIVALENGGLVELEALVRWEHPIHGLIPPIRFIPLAEETGLILPLGLWVLRTACAQVRAWQLRDPQRAPAQISVNVSARQLWSGTFVDDVAEVLRSTGLQPAALKLELTESMLLSKAEATLATLEQIKALGVKLAIDDFGTGYSSLSYVRRFPVDVIKIDKSFIDGLGTSRENTAIVRNVVELAKALGLAVTGEGIETVEQWDLLRDLGCDRGQGYYFAKPLTVDQIDALLDDAGTPANYNPHPELATAAGSRAA